MILRILCFFVIAGVCGCHGKIVRRGDYPVTVHDGDRVLAHCQKWNNQKVVVSGCKIEDGVTLDQVLTAIMKQIYEPSSASAKADVDSKI